MDGKYLLQPRHVARAVQLQQPAIVGVLNDPQFVWGPQGIVILVGSPAFNGEILEFVVGELNSQQIDEFREVAKGKLQESLRTGRPSHSVVNDTPWALKKGDSLYAGAVAEDTELAVAVSGAKGFADKNIAWAVFNYICLCVEGDIRDLTDDEIYVVTVD